MGELTWDRLQDAYLEIVETIPLVFTEGVALPFPGTILRIGSEGEDVRLLQTYLNEIAGSYPEIPSLPATGYFGNQTADAVSAFQERFGVGGTRGTVNSVVWNAITDVYSDLYLGRLANEGQYPGYEIGGETV